MITPVRHCEPAQRATEKASGAWWDAEATRAKAWPSAKDGKKKMAFTDVETAQVHDAVKMDPTGEDLCKLGLLYSTGQCGVIDFVEAHKWFNLAALMGSDSAKYYRSEVAAEMDGEQIAEALSAARSWLSTRH